MGVPGLTSFLDANNHLLTDLHLRDTKIVIDGNNLYHFLYAFYGVPVTFGGDYDVFYKSVSSFFSTLLKCNVAPIVVFDGPYDPKDKKLQTAIRRAKDRIQRAQSVVSGQEARLTPLLAQQVFTDALDDLSIDHVTCDGEADSDTAALANVFGCPVLSNDSDFFIFDIAGGVILLDYLNIEVHRDKSDSVGASKYYIRGQLYRQKNFLSVFPGMHQDMIALLATILGNDRVDTKVFEQFFTSVRLPSPTSDKLFSRRKNCKILGLLNWLESRQTVDNATEKILVHYKKNQRPDLKLLINDSINSYKNISGSKLHQTLKNRRPQEESDCVMVSVSLGASGLPDWFLTKLSDGRLSSLVTNVAVSRRAILLSQPENVAQPSAHWVARPLRRVLYGVVLGPNGSQNVEEIDRDIKGQKRSLVEVAGRQVPGLFDIEGTSKAALLLVIREALGLTEDWLEAWPPNLQLYLGTVMYWVNHAEPRLDTLHLDVVTLCVIKLGALDELCNEYKANKEDNNSTTESCSVSDISTCSNGLEDGYKSIGISKGILPTVRSSCSKEVVVQVKQNLDKFCGPQRGRSSSSSSCMLDSAVMHSFSQLQACILAASGLNQALALPLEAIRLGQVFNGTFLYILYKELRSRVKPEQYIMELLARSSPILQIYKETKESIERCLTPGALRPNLPPGSKRSKKSAAKKKSKVNQDRREEVEGGDKQTTANDNLVANCELANKFGCLELTDS